MKYFVLQNLVKLGKEIMKVDQNFYFLKMNGEGSEQEHA
jgi:hypothetical protein